MVLIYMNTEKVIKAGKIASQIREYAKKIVKSNVPLLEIAEKIESKIAELGGKCAFPTNLSINEIAAHYTPSYNDETLAHGLLKVDFGVHVDGWIADTAFSVDLENSEENKKLIQTSEDALSAAIKTIKEGVTTSQIGKDVQKTIESYGFLPIMNLSGHALEKYELHAGITIPNIDDKRNVSIKKGAYAIEPFATNGSGKVRDGKPSGIYELIYEGNPRSQIAREILEFIIDNYQTLPFCSRWIFKEFGIKGLFALRQLEENGNLHHFAQLIESNSNSRVAQSEHTILLEKDKVIVTTE